MSSSEVQAVQQEYIALATYFGRSIDNIVLQMYGADLRPHPYDDVRRAMRAVRLQKGRRTLPLPGDIIELMQAQGGGSLQQANLIAGRISESIVKHGYTNAARAEAYIGEVGWRVVQRRGGWTHICQTLQADEVGTFFAQCRDLALAELSQKSQARAEHMPDAIDALVERTGISLPANTPGALQKVL